MLIASFCSFFGEILLKKILLFFRRNLSRAVTLLEMIKRREKTKREHVHLGIEIFEKRYQAKDFNGCLLNEFTNNAVKSSRYASLFSPRRNFFVVDKSRSLMFSYFCYVSQIGLCTIIWKPVCRSTVESILVQFWLCNGGQFIIAIEQTRK